MGLADDMVPALCRRYKSMDVERVVNAWNRGMAGEVTRKEWEGKGSQVAASFIEGLYTEPWHGNNRYPWIASLEANADAIRDELRRVCSEELPETIAWVPAVGDEKEAYGPGWQKLVLQDRKWDAAACNLFPKTFGVIKDSGVPSVDVMFARQSANSGIKPHTYNSNFFLAAHLALEVPGGDCWIRVGEEKRKWQEDKAFVFDSSFVHETRNDTPSDKVVMVVRFWHPQLTGVEKSALDFILSALDDPLVLEQPFGLFIEPLDCDDETVQVEPNSPAPTALGSEPRRKIATQPLGPAGEAVRLDGFLADLKAEGLLPAATSKEAVLDQGPKNRNDRRKASKARKRAHRPGKSKKR